MFRLRSSIAVLAVLAAGAVLPAQTATPGAQEQTPVFRGGVEVLPLDVTVLDRDGRQVVDLTSDDFTVEVDGKPRKVVSAEYIRQTDALEAGLAPRGPAPVIALPPPFDYGITCNGGGLGP